MIPPLEPHCGSWIIVRRSTATPVLETFERVTAERINLTAYAVYTAAQWLGTMNRAIKAGHADCCRAACDELEGKN
jgi:hypothetical protein